MALGNFTFNHFRYLMGIGGVNLASGGDQFDIALLSALPSQTKAECKDYDTVDTFFSGGGASEISVSGYTRVTIAGQAWTEDDTNDWCKFTFDPVTWEGLATGETIVGFIILQYVTDDTDSVPCFYADTIDGNAISQATNGGDVTLTLGDDGFAHHIDCE